MKERKDVEGAKDTVENLNRRLTTLDSEFKNEVLNLDAKSSQKDLETVTIKPGKANISVKTWFHLYGCLIERNMMQEWTMIMINR